MWINSFLKQTDVLNMNLLLVGLFLIVYGGHVGTTKELHCYDCSLLARTQDCKYIRKCGEHEICHLEIFVTRDANTLYSMGCKDSNQCSSGFGRRASNDVLVCSDCCNDTLCNNNLCNAPGYSQIPSRGPICTDCVDQRKTDSCNSITVCGRDQVCKLKWDKNASIYRSGCAEANTCKVEYDTLSNIYNPIGKKRDSHEVSSSGKCLLQCCDEDLCNIGCSVSPVNSTTAATMTTKAITASPQPSTATPSSPITTLSPQTTKTTSPSSQTTTTMTPYSQTTKTTTLSPQTTKTTALSPQTTKTTAPFPQTTKTTTSSTASSSLESTTPILVPTRKISAQTVTSGSSPVSVTMSSTTAKQSAVFTPIPNTTGSTTAQSSLSSSPLTTLTTKITTAQPTITTTTTTSTTPTPTINPCMSAPCKYGSCSATSNRDYQCNCNLGAYGPRCEKYIDPCTFDPCFHGTCSSNMATYTCLCRSGYTGKDCETHIISGTHSVIGGTHSAPVTTSTSLHQTTDGSVKTVTNGGHANRTSTMKPLFTLPPETMTCAKCAGPVELCERLFASKPCDPPNNYCINRLTNKADGSRIISRECGNFRDCVGGWYRGSSDNYNCLSFKEDEVKHLDFHCVYCCIKNNCNTRIHPSEDTLYKG